MSDETICTLCDKGADKISLTGTKLVGQKQKEYKLCSECTRQLTQLSTYKAVDVKKRRAFWDSVWDSLQ